MAQPFGHEKLIVYQKGIRFVTLRGALLDGLTRRHAHSTFKGGNP